MRPATRRSAATRSRSARAASALTSAGVTRMASFVRRTKGAIRQAEVRALAARAGPRPGGRAAARGGTPSRLSTVVRWRRLLHATPRRIHLRGGGPAGGVGRALRARHCGPIRVDINAIPARVTVAVATPPKALKSNPAVAAALVVAGVNGEAYGLGGAQARSLWPTATETVQPVCAIVGPGNAWVACAKRHVGAVSIDSEQPHEKWPSSPTARRIQGYVAVNSCWPRRTAVAMRRWCW